ncbi:MAG: helix-turn-helix transcriptional regulator [Odoribacteraceae bacterium]|jgi:AraC-like DNA-binding protein|nr:helix-turn-helix transcriptional regulator [Odoribacteraceae bacterium]
MKEERDFKKIPLPVHPASSFVRDTLVRVTDALKELIDQEKNEARRYELSLVLEDASALSEHFPVPLLSPEEEFVQRALYHVERNIDNTDYSVNDLAKELGLCRSNLFRRLHAITGQTPSVFIRQARMQRAAQLLQGTPYRISEIADMVGFNSLKHFNRHFKEAFGKSPTTYRLGKARGEEEVGA